MSDTVSITFNVVGIVFSLAIIAQSFGRFGSPAYSLVGAACLALNTYLLLNTVGAA